MIVLIQSSNFKIMKAKSTAEVIFANIVGKYTRVSRDETNTGKNANTGLTVTQTTILTVEVTRFP